jgi:hypothetical protein
MSVPRPEAVRHDCLIQGEKDGWEIFDSLATPTKDLHWIEESNQRFYTYNSGQHPELLVGWFDRYISE